MLPLAEELGYGFTIEELRKYETKIKLSNIKDEDSGDYVPEEVVFYLLDQGWDNDPDIFKKK